MAITRIACPECEAGMTSPTGFTVGQTVCCPKCETYFAVEAQSGEPDDDVLPKTKSASAEGEWSYKNSWIRYVVLGVLLITLGVLSYMLYEKKRNENQEPPSSAAGRGLEVAVPPTDLIPFQPAPAGAGAGPGAGPRPGGGARPGPLTGDQLEEVKKQIVGVWSNGVVSYDYKENGDFVFTDAKNKSKNLTGKWKLVSGSSRGSGQYQLGMEWTPEGKATISDSVVLNGNRFNEHPILEADGSGKTPGKNFIRQN